MTQRIIITTTQEGSRGVVQSGDWSACSVTFATAEEAWHWAKTILMLRQELTNYATAQQIAEEVGWNQVL